MNMSNDEIEKIVYNENTRPDCMLPASYSDVIYNGDIVVCKNALTQAQCSHIIKYFKRVGKDKFYDVGKQGMSMPDEVGSKRITTFDVEFAKMLNGALSMFMVDTMRSATVPVHDYSLFSPNTSLRRKITVDDMTSVDAAHGDWQYRCVSPVFRYMEYSEGGEHYPHYDAPYKYQDGLQTLFSGVLYLTTVDYVNGEGGATVFVKDEKNEYLRFKNRDTRDWERQATDDEVFVKVAPVAGTILLFNHQIPHAVEEYQPIEKYKKRIIIRFDVVYSLI